LIGAVRVARARQKAVNELARLILPLCSPQARGTEQERLALIVKRIDTFGGTLDLEVSAAEKTLADKVVEIDWDGIGG
jgi:hypothetical protein